MCMNALCDQSVTDPSAYMFSPGGEWGRVATWVRFGLGVRLRFVTQTTTVNCVSFNENR